MEIDLEKYEINTFLWYISYKQSLSAGLCGRPNNKVEAFSFSKFYP